MNRKYITKYVAILTVAFILLFVGQAPAFFGNNQSPNIPDVDGYGGLTAAVASIGVTEQAVLIKTAQTVSGDLTIPTTLNLVFVKGGSVSVATSKTLTIYSPSNIIASQGQQIFTGAGTVVFSDNTSLESCGPWFGKTATVESASGISAGVTKSLDLTSGDKMRYTGKSDLPDTLWLKATLDGTNDYLQHGLRIVEDITNSSGGSGSNLNLLTKHAGANGWHTLQTYIESNGTGDIAAIYARADSVGGGNPWGLDLTVVADTVAPDQMIGARFQMSDSINTTTLSRGVEISSVGSNAIDYGLIIRTNGAVAGFTTGIYVQSSTNVTTTMDYGLYIHEQAAGTMTYGAYINGPVIGLQFNGIANYEIVAINELRVLLGTSNSHALELYKDSGAGVLAMQLYAGGLAEMNGIGFANSGTFTSGDTTPAVGHTTVWKTFTSAAGTNITDFDGNASSNLLIIIGGGGASPDILVDGGNLALAGNWTGTANHTITLIKNGTTWYELSRSAN